ncbi:hypothetical protein AB8Q18_08595 [Neisseriaceae bacterium CLB008]
MTKRIFYWLGPLLLFFVWGFIDHAVPATPPPIPTQSPVGEILTAVDTELNYRSLYRNVTVDQLMMGNICIEINDNECEVYR